VAPCGGWGRKSPPLPAGWKPDFQVFRRPWMGFNNRARILHTRGWREIHDLLLSTL